MLLLMGCRIEIFHAFLEKHKTFADAILHALEYEVSFNLLVENNQE